MSSSRSRAVTRRAFLASSLAGAAALACGRAPALRTRKSWDVAIVGSGFAGVYLAARLADAGLDVLVLEAGDFPPPDRIRNAGPKLFAVASVGPESYDVEISRAIAVGGTSSKWAGTLARLAPEDVRTRTLYGYGEDWPVTVEELDPFYCEAQRLLFAVGAPFREGPEPPRSCPYPDESLGDDTLPTVEVAAGVPLRFFRYAGSRRPGDGEPVRLAEREIPELAARGNVDFRANRPVLSVRGGGGGAVGEIEVANPGGGRETVRAGVVVIAAGVVESARLLLASARAQSIRLEGNAADLVGRHFHEHPVTRFEFATPPREGLPRGLFRTFDFSRRLRAEGLRGCGHKVVLTSDIASVRVQPEGDALAENRLRWSSATDPFGRSGLELDYRRSEAERSSRARGEEAAGELAAKLALGDPVEEPLRTYRMHPTGTCRMGTSAASGVVDRDLRVFGVENLYVVGASVFPTNGIGNPTLTVVALALRLADHLLTTRFASRGARIS